MGEIAEFERRITAALQRIGAGLDQLGPITEAQPGPDAGDLAADVASLRDALDDERTVNAQLGERLRAVKEREAEGLAEAQARIEAMTRQLDVQGLELQRMRKTTIQLREQLRVLREAQTQGLADPQMLNKAMLGELEALRAARQSETAELDEILAELAPLLQEEQIGG
ncbi:hypothetical protein [Rhodobacter ferrooxidans]|uniref:Uncharacterized protein n=1 Tax=Rhodobacter ferrooxidans TaxID=371731 RepID=C8RZJ9_9RHOB|nr:hypothetical protein [Rhodobacter sp. SW2]EEW25796.1 conserved hypothetical protein [Rhodobacter sp. SW2]